MSRLLAVYCRVMLTRGTIEAATGRQPLSGLLALTLQLESVTEVGLLGRHCPRLRSLNLDSNLLATLQGMRQRSDPDYFANPFLPLTLTSTLCRTGSVSISHGAEPARQPHRQHGAAGGADGFAQPGPYWQHDCHYRGPDSLLRSAWLEPHGGCDYDVMVASYHVLGRSKHTLAANVLILREGCEARCRFISVSLSTRTSGFMMRARSQHLLGCALIGATWCVCLPGLSSLMLNGNGLTNLMASELDGCAASMTVLELAGNRSST